jgi:hypothetical protein
MLEGNLGECGSHTAQPRSLLVGCIASTSQIIAKGHDVNNGAEQGVKGISRYTIGDSAQQFDVSP